MRKSGCSLEAMHQYEEIWRALMSAMYVPDEVNASILFMKLALSGSSLRRRRLSSSFLQETKHPWVFLIVDRQIDI